MIRFVIGLLIIFGVAGGLDTVSDGDLVYSLLACAGGLLLMVFGANSMESKK